MVVDIHEVDIVKGTPLDTALVQVADAIRGQVGDFDLNRVFARLKEAADVGLEGDAPEVGCGLAVDDDAGAFANVAEAESVVGGAWIVR